MIDQRKIRYATGYRYQLVDEYCTQTPFRPDVCITTDFIELHQDGWIVIRKGYAWDGATCTTRPKSSVRASLVHDALYQLMREGHLDVSQRDAVDALFEKLLIEDGMSKLRASAWRWAVNNFGDHCKDPSAGHPIETAP